MARGRASRGKRALGWLGDRTPVVRTRRGLAGLKEVEARVFRYRTKESVGKYLAILEALPGKASRVKLLALLDDKRLTISQRREAAKILERKEPYPSLSLYLKIKDLGQRATAGKRARQRITLDYAEEFFLRKGRHSPVAVREYLKLLEENPGKAASEKLVRLVKGGDITRPKLTLAERINAAEILEKMNNIMAQNLYRQRLPNTDTPVILRSHIVKFLGRAIGAGEEGIIFRKPLKRAMMDPAQGPITRGLCIEVLASKTRPPIKLFKRIAKERGVDHNLKAKALEAIEKLEKK